MQPYRRILDESVPESFDAVALFIDDADAPVITDNPDNPDTQGQPNGSPTCYFKFYNVTAAPSELDGHTVELQILRAERTGAPKWVSNVDLAKLDSGTYKVQPSKGLVYIETPPYTDFFPSCGATFSGVFVVDGERRDALTWSWTVANPGYGDSTASCNGGRGASVDVPQLGETLVCDARERLGSAGQRRDPNRGRQMTTVRREQGMVVAKRVSWRSLVGVALGAALVALGTTAGAGATGPQSDAPKQVKTKPAPVLYVMNASSGTLTAGSADDELVLALAGVNPTSTWFTDRPARRAGTAPVGPALKSIGFSGDQGPPNAVLEIPGAPADENAVALTLTEPVYDDAAATLQFTATPLERVGSSRGLQPYRRILDESVPESFDAASLFIDDADAPVITANSDNPDSQGRPNATPACAFSFKNVSGSSRIQLMVLSAIFEGGLVWIRPATFDSGSYLVDAGQTVNLVSTTIGPETCAVTAQGIFVVDGERRDEFNWRWKVSDPPFADSTAECNRLSAVPPDLLKSGETFVCDASVNSSGQPAQGKVEVGIR